uniref:Phosphatase and actin regulator n=1 Tax=Callorhinchus milii TaxID=7868 RepID=A0A4W3HMR2_CALMI
MYCTTQSSCSSLASDEKPLSEVDVLEKPCVTGSEVPPPRSETPPLKRKSKLASIGKIFKPWKWRKKKASEQFRETSVLLERKISMRQTREELIRKGVLKDGCERDGEGHRAGTKNGLPSPINIETVTKEHPTTPDTGCLAEQTVPTLTQVADHSAEPEMTGDSFPPSLTPSQPPSEGHCKDIQDTSSPPGLPDIPSKPEDHSESPTRTSLPTRLGSAEPSEPQPEKPGQMRKPARGIPGNVCVCDWEAMRLPASSDQGQHFPRDAPIPDPVRPVKPEPETGEMERSAGSLEHSQQETGETLKCTSDQSNVTNEHGEGRQESRVLIDDSTPVAIIPPAEYPESVSSDSDSEGPVLYRDEPEDEEDDECLNSSLANKIRRRDTLALKLRNRPTKRELEEKNIIPRSSDEERLELRQQIGTKLIRRLSQRPTLEELEQRNILRQRNEEEEHEERLEIRRRLIRKLSLRPTVAELQARRILRFNEYVEVTEVQDYDRRADKPWTRLTPADKAAIRKELNEFKSREMEVHEESKHLTRFHRP